MASSFEFYKVIHTCTLAFWAGLAERILLTDASTKTILKLSLKINLGQIKYYKEPEVLAGLSILLK
jgi:hypothetical protein